MMIRSYFRAYASLTWENTDYRNKRHHLPLSHTPFLNMKENKRSKYIANLTFLIQASELYRHDESISRYDLLSQVGVQQKRHSHHQNFRGIFQ